MATALVYDYAGSDPLFRAYHYADYPANGADLAYYAAVRGGPYAQYGR